MNSNKLPATLSHGVHLVSIGMSCQTKHQINNIADIAPSCFFDWLICPASGLVGLLDRNFPIPEKADLAIVNNHVYWKEYSIFFWHEFGIVYKKASNEFLHIQYESFVEKYKKRALDFANLDATKAIFVYSNTQNNLAKEVFRTENPRCLPLSSNSIEQVSRAINKFFKRNSKVIFISNRDRFSGSSNGLHNLFLISNDESRWQGSVSHWKSILSRYV